MQIHAFERKQIMNVNECKKAKNINNVNKVYLIVFRNRKSFLNQSTFLLAS